MTDPFGQWIILQDQAIDLQRKQFEAMQQTLKAATELSDAQRAVNDATMAGMSLWRGWLAMWGVR